MQFIAKFSVCVFTGEGRGELGEALQDPGEGGARILASEAPE